MGQGSSIQSNLARYCSDFCLRLGLVLIGSGVVPKVVENIVRGQSKALTVEEFSMITLLLLFGSILVILGGYLSTLS
jgi:phosphate/sulfate permease